MPTEHEIRVEGDRVAAVHHAAVGERWLFFCHGFRSDKTGSYENRCERAVEAGYDAVRFDFRGSGDSDRAFVEATLTSRIDDLRAVIERFDPRSYACVGSSFGAKVAFHAAAGPLDPTAIVARAPVTYNRAFDADRRAVEAEGTLRYDDEHAIDERFFEDVGTYGFDDAAGEIGAPVGIFHGESDESVPIADSFDAAAALETDVLLETYAGEGHRFSEAAERRFLDRAFGWLEDVYGDGRAGVHERD
ncbi:alpha/beta hydrolase fold protein [Natronomonas moolapensis 8.8.11]|uniref:Alpha/beta hydrolase fold protein n=1 Tax=Natronomonas moolapensis (strain DSM 18674 / CECT 7526 / JCM 14361 / 8.8.11) TaxID=268739 RepID=M1XU64_NATM8|nr:alpha/beta fold hydrolase [Natronomonas moolapensis]CCQ38022.1 alpha/beta hydrolase fold protein [Natronomonas moolapensis 8.8.11]